MQNNLNSTALDFPLAVSRQSDMKISDGLAKSIFKIKNSIAHTQDFEQSIVDKLKEHDNSIQFTQGSQTSRKNSVALIQCFYGTESSRIDAVNTALAFMLKSRPLPAEWVFIEAQQDEADAKFKWLADEGVSYWFIKLSDDPNRYIKGQLWNIGVSKTTAENLVFVDADVMFCRGSWVESVNSALSRCDVISAHKKTYYAQQPDEKAAEVYELHSSLGYLLSSNPYAKGHPGFTIGMTRKFYTESFEQFDLCSVPYDDVLWWGKIIGYPVTKEYPYRGKLEFEKCKPDVKIGYADEICCHICHQKLAVRNDVSEIERLNAWISEPFGEFEMSPDANGITPLTMAYREHIGQRPSDFRRNVTILGEPSTEVAIKPGIVKPANSVQPIQEHSDNDESCVVDVSLIQCFTGTDIDMLADAMDAIQNTTSLNAKPKEWIFVEAQTSRGNAAFSWLTNYGVKYVFKKLTKQNEGLPLKHALWNIGAKHAKTSKLLFIDTSTILTDDVMLRSSDALMRYDVISPWKTIEIDSAECSSFGSTLQSSDTTGCTEGGIGMTSSAYGMLADGFSSKSDEDIDIWHDMTGLAIREFLAESEGLPVAVGYADATVTMLSKPPVMSDHRRKIYDCMFTRSADPVVVSKLGLPSWNVACPDSKLVAEMAALLREKDDCDLNADVEMETNILMLNSVERAFGEVNDDHPLIVFCGYKPNFKMKTIEAIYEKKMLLEQHCYIPFTFVCFTDDPGNADELGIDVIPFSSKEVRDDRRRWKDEIKRKDVVFPKNQVVEYLIF